MTGLVYMVGAGPGDPGLITVRGLKCLRRADVVIYDRLIQPQLLDEAPIATGEDRRPVKRRRPLHFWTWWGGVPGAIPGWHSVRDGARCDQRHSRTCLCRNSGDTSRVQ